MPQHTQNSPIQTDAQGREYIDTPRGRVYLSPVTRGEAAPTDETGIFRSRPRWNQQKGKFETPIDWGNILSIATGAGLGAAGLSAAGVFGGGASASAGGGVPNLAGPAGLPGGPAYGAAAPAGVPNLLGKAGLPGGPAYGAAAAPPAAAAGKNALDRIKDVGKKAIGGDHKGFNPFELAALAALSGLPALFANKGPSNEEKALQDQVRRMTELQQRRIEHQNPLFEAVTRLAMSRLPTANQGEVSPLQGAR